MTSPRHDFLFVDESGDAGYTLERGTRQLLSTRYFVMAALHICDDSIRDLNAHVAAFRYLSSLVRELKIPHRDKSAEKFLQPIAELAESTTNLWASVVYVDKERYTGRYLRPTADTGTDSLRFRNYVLRRLLRHHFDLHPLKSRQYDLVLDRFDMASSDLESLTRYLKTRPDIPPPTYVTQASSIYVEGLQVVHNLANGYYGSLKNASALPSYLSFATPMDLSENRLGTQ